MGLKNSFIRYITSIAAPTGFFFMKQTDASLPMRIVKPPALTVQAS